MVVDCQRAIARLSTGLLALVVVVGAGCDDPPPPEEDNRPPIAVGIIPDDIVLVGESRHVDVTEYFREPDSLDILVYTAELSDESVVTVEMEGAVLTYIGEDTGESDITVTATDPGDESAEQKFEVTVLHPNRPPLCGFFPVTLPIDITVEEDLKVICFDPDNDSITSYSVESSDPDIVSARLADETLIYETVSVGIATVTVTATDTEGNTGEGDLVVTVAEDDSIPPPVLAYLRSDAASSSDEEPRPYCYFWYGLERGYHARIGPSEGPPPRTNVSGTVNLLEKMNENKVRWVTPLGDCLLDLWHGRIGRVTTRWADTTSTGDSVTRNLDYRLWERTRPDPLWPPGWERWNIWSFLTYSPQPSFENDDLITDLLWLQLVSLPDSARGLYDLVVYDVKPFWAVKAGNEGNRPLDYKPTKCWLNHNFNQVPDTSLHRLSDSEACEVP